MLGKRTIKTVFPKTKQELVKQINLLGRIEIEVIQTVSSVDEKKAEQALRKFIRTNRGSSTIVLIKKSN